MNVLKSAGAAWERWEVLRRAEDICASNNTFDCTKKFQGYQKLWVQGHFYSHGINKLRYQNEIFQCWRWERLQRTWPPVQTWFKELLDWKVVQVCHYVSVVCVRFRTRNGLGGGKKKSPMWFLFDSNSVLECGVECRIESFWLMCSQIVLCQMVRSVIAPPDWKGVPLNPHNTPLEPIRWIWIRWGSCKQTPGKGPLSFTTVAPCEPLSPARRACVCVHAAPCCLSWPCQDVFFSNGFNCWCCECWGKVLLKF